MNVAHCQVTNEIGTSLVLKNHKRQQVISRSLVLSNLTLVLLVLRIHSNPLLLNHQYKVLKHPKWTYNQNDKQIHAKICVQLSERQMRINCNNTSNKTYIDIMEVSFLWSITTNCRYSMRELPNFIAILVTPKVQCTKCMHQQQRSCKQCDKSVNVNVYQRECSTLLRYVKFCFFNFVIVASLDKMFTTKMCSDVNQMTADNNVDKCKLNFVPQNYKTL